jgi:hypothetical protein
MLVAVVLVVIQAHLAQAVPVVLVLLQVHH